MKTFVVTLVILGCVGTFESVNGQFHSIEILSPDGTYIPGNSN